MILMSLLLTLHMSTPTVPVVGLADLEERFAQGGDTVFVVNFWATWCKPCIEELPAFDKFHRSVGDRSIKVLLVSLDDPEELSETVVPFLKRKGYRPECVLLDEPKPHEWIDKVDDSWSGAIPATWLIDAATDRRQFFERDFTFDELTQTVDAFIKAAP